MRISGSSICSFFDYNILRETRTIYLGDTSASGEIDPSIASSVIKGIHTLQNLNSEPIRIILNTRGGCVDNGLAIYDALHDCLCYVTAEVIGSAMSMGSIILQAADERVMHMNAVIMLHEISLSIEGPVQNVENWTKFYNQKQSLSYKILASRTNRTAKYWEKKCTSDYILTAEKALSEGLIDRICGLED